MFLTTLIMVGIAFFYLTIGFILSKLKAVKADHLKSISAILVYILSPALAINSFLNVECTKENTIEIIKFFFTTLILMLITALIMFLILRKKIDRSESRLTIIATFMGNVGFFGMPVVQAIFPTEPLVMLYSSMFCISMNILSYSIGSYFLTMDKKYISLKQIFFNPSTVALAIGIPLYAFKVSMNDLAQLGSAINLLGKMTTPVCMFIIGIRLANCDFRKLFSKPYVYLCCVLKLIVFPLFCYFAVRFIPFFSYTFKVCILIMCSCPSASMISSLSELYGVEQENAANIVLLSVLSCIITIPLMTLLAGI